MFEVMKVLFSRSQSNPPYSTMSKGPDAGGEGFGKALEISQKTRSCTFSHNLPKYAKGLYVDFGSPALPVNMLNLSSKSRMLLRVWLDWPLMRV